MSAATTAINTPMLEPKIWEFPVAAATTLYAGTLAALDTSGNVVPAADTAGLRALGRVEEDVDNSAGAAGDLTVHIRRATFRFANSGSAAVDADDKGKICFVEDDNTVAETSTNKVIAGRVIDVDTDGVWVDTAGDANLIVPVSVTDGTTNGAAAGAADLAALKTEAELIGDALRATIVALKAQGILR